MADLTITRNTTLPNSSSKADFHNLVDTATGTVTNIVNADINSSAAIASSKLDLSAVGQKIAMNGKAIDQAQGSNIASASSIDLGAATGNYVVVTGTTGITALGTVQAGTQRIVEFSGALTITHNATSLILPGGANITTATGDVAIFVSEGSGNWRCVSYTKATGKATISSVATTDLPAGSIVQVVNTISSAVATGTTSIPYDDTIPQNTEGDQYMTLAITPTSATNKLQIDVVFVGALPSGGNSLSVALFQDTTANALACASQTCGTANITTTIKFTHYMTSGTTSSTTFKVRAGSSGAETLTFNGASSARKYGGVAASSITITEVKV